jgi:hypothetical protein
MRSDSHWGASAPASCSKQRADSLNPGGGEGVRLASRCGKGLRANVSSHIIDVTSSQHRKHGYRRAAAVSAKTVFAVA